MISLINVVMVLVQNLISYVQLNNHVLLDKLDVGIMNVKIHYLTVMHYKLVLVYVHLILHIDVLMVHVQINHLIVLHKLYVQFKHLLNVMMEHVNHQILNVILKLHVVMEIEDVQMDHVNLY